MCWNETLNNVKTFDFYQMFVHVLTAKLGCDETDMSMHNTMKILCVWDKSGPVRITTVVAQI